MKNDKSSKHKLVTDAAIANEESAARDSAIMMREFSLQSNRNDLIQRCELFESTLAAGGIPSENPYALMSDSYQLPIERHREMNHEFLKCLKRMDVSNILKIEEELKSQDADAGRILLRCIMLLLICALALSKTIQFGYDSIPNQIVMVSIIIVTLISIGYLVPMLMSAENQKCLLSWATMSKNQETSLEKTEAKPVEILE